MARKKSTTKKRGKKRAKKEGPFISTARAKKTPGRTVQVGGTQVLRVAGKKPLSFRKGALHRALGVPQGQKIPAGKKAAALRGDYGPAVKKMAVFAFRGALAAGRQTAGRGKKRK